MEKNIKKKTHLRCMCGLPVENLITVQQELYEIFCIIIINITQVFIV